MFIEKEKRTLRDDLLRYSQTEAAMPLTLSFSMLSKDLIGTVQQLQEEVIRLKEKDRLKDATIEELERRLEYVEAITSKDSKRAYSNTLV
jgi:hypothetical protein